MRKAPAKGSAGDQAVSHHGASSIRTEVDKSSASGRIFVLQTMLSKDDLLQRKMMWDSVETQIHEFFRSRGYTFFRTPLLVPSPGMEPNLDPFEVDVAYFDRKNEVRRMKAGLITSPEYSMKKLLGAGLRNIYTITPVFRNTESIAPFNTPEFTMLEWYGSGDYEDCMKETEELVNTVLGREGAWPRIAHKDAQVDAVGDPRIIQEHDRVFVHQFPVEQASLAKLSEDGTYAERFEGFVDGVELCNGFSELTDSKQQRRRFEKEARERVEQGKTVFPIDEDLLQSIENIDEPIYGNALGVDRLVMLKYRKGDINDIQLFIFYDKD